MVEKKEEKKWYDVKVEAHIPATLTYRVYAENPMIAMELIKNSQPVGVKHKLTIIKKLNILVYKMGCSAIEYGKRFM